MIPRSRKCTCMCLFLKKAEIHEIITGNKGNCQIDQHWWPALMTMEVKALGCRGGGGRTGHVWHSPIARIFSGGRWGSRVTSPWCHLSALPLPASDEEAMRQPPPPPRSSWIEPVRGRRGWNGLIASQKDLTGDKEAVWKPQQPPLHPSILLMGLLEKTLQGEGEGGAALSPVEKNWLATRKPHGGCSLSPSLHWVFLKRSSKLR